VLSVTTAKRFMFGPFAGRGNDGILRIHAGGASVCAGSLHIPRLQHV